MWHPIVGSHWYSEYSMILRKNCREAQAISWKYLSVKQGFLPPSRVHHTPALLVVGDCLIFVGLDYRKQVFLFETLFKEVIRSSKQRYVDSLFLYVRNQQQMIAQISRFSFALCLQLSCVYQNVKSYFENRVSRTFSSQQNSLLQSSYTKFTALFEIASLVYFMLTR